MLPKLISFFLLQQFLFPCFVAKNIATPRHCVASSCGTIPNISYPFRLKDDPHHCGNHSYELVCEENTTIAYINHHKYSVRAINYDNYTIRLVDYSITNSTCSFPTNVSLGPFSFPRGSPYTTKFNDYDLTESINFISCPYPVNASDLTEIDSCTKRNQSGDDDPGKRYTYIKFAHLNGLDVKNMCTIEVVVMTSLNLGKKARVSLSEVHASLVYGFELSWLPLLCGAECYGDCWLFGTQPQCGAVVDMTEWDTTPLDVTLVYLTEFVLLVALPIIYLVLRFFIMLIMFALLISKFRRRHLSMFEGIEIFLQGNSNNLIPIRFSYSNVKLMTRGFRDKLGEGGYGSVYKGQLGRGCHVAVKLLNKPKTNPQDFINEIATIGRIHHTNVIKLIGYCFEGSKCALVYDFMPNGSLDKYLFGQERSNSLSSERLYEIAMGVARGIEYLHEGCNIRILHFDIKPHNILLDHKFTPKLSDFGLAKYYSTERSMVTLTAPRGTFGYVAPELINRSFGTVSSKADVYSFGMLLLDMVGLKDIVPKDCESSQYFPDWIYDRLERGADIETGNIGEIVIIDDECAGKVMKKMTIVGLWCTQMSPCTRPSMNEVVKMLEGETEKIQMPPLTLQNVLYLCNIEALMNLDDGNQQNQIIH